MKRLLMFVAAICLLVPASAEATAGPNSAALSGKPLQIGSSDATVVPAVVVDPSGTAYIAWNVPATSAAGAVSNQVEYCVISAGASQCSATGELSAPGSPVLGNIALTIDGPDIVLVAGQFVAGSDQDDNYVNEWIAPEGTANFTAVDGGESVSNDNGYTQNALFTLPTAGSGGGPLGYGWGEVGDSNGSLYADVIDPFNAPPECSEVTCSSTPIADLGGPAGAATQTASSYAVATGSTPGVLGVFHTSFASACGGGGAGDAFVYGSGDQSPSNSYAISPGSAGSAWHGTASIFDCDGADVVADGGPAGLGAFEENTQSNTLEYRLFNQSSDSFSSPLTVEGSDGGDVNDLSANQDGAGGVYATYYAGNTLYKGPDDLSYSPDGGLIWDGPVALNNLSEPIDNSVSDVGADGQGWLVWEDANGNGSDADDNIYVQQFDQADVPGQATTLATTQTSGREHAAKLSIPAGTVGESDRATLSGTNAKAAGGTVKYKLLAGSCDPGLTLATYDEGTVNVIYGSVPASKAVTGALQAGTYYWVATYSGDRNNAASVSRCGSEVLVVSPAATVGGTVTYSTSTGALKVAVGCASTPCSGTVDVTASGSELGRRVSLKAATHKVTATLGSAKFKIDKKGRQTLTLKLTAAGRSFLEKALGHLTSSVKISEKINGHTVITIANVKLAK